MASFVVCKGLVTFLTTKFEAVELFLNVCVDNFTSFIYLVAAWACSIGAQPRSDTFAACNFSTYTAFFRFINNALAKVTNEIAVELRLNQIIGVEPTTCHSLRFKLFNKAFNNLWLNFTLIVMIVWLN